MVISGGNFAPDILKPKEVVSLLLDDDEMERKCTFRNILLSFLGGELEALSMCEIIFD
jgi:hypothetical protein